MAAHRRGLSDLFPSDWPDRFEREYGCTETEWRGWLPAAAHPHALEPAGPSALKVPLVDGSLWLQWKALPPRRIALLCLPRLQVEFRFEGVRDEARRAFMRRFDLHLQRGGG